MAESAKISTNDLGRFERILYWILGVRRGFGDGRRVIAVAMAADWRSSLNWFIPVLGILFGLAMLLFHEITMDPDSAGFGMMFRIFIFDYSLFLFGGLSGWNMARRWRANADQIEELSLTPLSPSVIASMMSAGALAIWLFLFVLFGFVDLFTPIIHAKWIIEMTEANDGSFFLVLPVTTYAVLMGLLGPFILAWFHFESIRLAHWMFAVHSLPRVSLLKAGIVNFIVMTTIVGTLSLLGSMVTGICLIVLGLIGEMLGQSVNSFEAFSAYTVWGLAALPGALVVLFLKRALVRTYEGSFTRSWLMYQWWGAGESQQPGTYPASLYKAIPLWQAFYGMQEEEILEKPMSRRPQTRRYYALLERLKAANSSTNENKVSPPRILTMNYEEPEKPKIPGPTPPPGYGALANPPNMVIPTAPNEIRSHPPTHGHGPTPPPSAR